jgi:hypothetical protein
MGDDAYMAEFGEPPPEPAPEGEAAAAGDEAGDGAAEAQQAERGAQVAQQVGQVLRAVQQPQPFLLLGLAHRRGRALRKIQEALALSMFPLFKSESLRDAASPQRAASPCQRPETTDKRVQAPGMLPAP